MGTPANGNNYEIAYERKRNYILFPFTVLLSLSLFFVLNFTAELMQFQFPTWEFRDSNIVPDTGCSD
jgi:hypothetical protein